jgi:hypothetical protein
MDPGVRRDDVLDVLALKALAGMTGLMYWR